MGCSNTGYDWVTRQEKWGKQVDIVDITMKSVMVSFIVNYTILLLLLRNKTKKGVPLKRLP